MTTTTSGSINITPSGAANTGVLVKPTTDSTAAFQIQNAGASNYILDADTTNGRIGIGTNAPSAELNVTGTGYTVAAVASGNGTAAANA